MKFRLAGADVSLQVPPPVMKAIIGIVKRGNVSQDIPPVAKDSTLIRRNGTASLTAKMLGIIGMKKHKIVSQNILVRKEPTLMRMSGRVFPIVKVMNTTGMNGLETVFFTARMKGTIGMKKYGIVFQNTLLVAKDSTLIHKNGTASLIAKMLDITGMKKSKIVFRGILVTKIPIGIHTKENVFFIVKMKDITGMKKYGTAFQNTLLVAKDSTLTHKNGTASLIAKMLDIIGMKKHKIVSQNILVKKEPTLMNTSGRVFLIVKAMNTTGMNGLGSVCFTVKMRGTTGMKKHGTAFLDVIDFPFFEGKRKHS
jgi:hypothetical protein